MYRKVLLPLDGSDLAESMIAVARGAVAKNPDSQLILYTVVEPFRGQPFRSSDDWSERMAKEGEKAARNYLEQLVEKLKADGIRAISVVERGDPAGSILEFASKNGVDLIVMSTHGRSGLSRLVFGSVAEKVLHHSTIPVLIEAPHQI